MASGITLRKGGLSQDFRDSLEDYYGSVDRGMLFADHKWRQWAEAKSITTYIAERDGKAVGWIAYNPHHSTIEEILPKKNGADPATIPTMIDALIAGESLVSAEMLKADRAKVDTLTAYGFRPTRAFSSNGFDLVRMDLSTAEFLRKVRGWKPSKEYGKTELVAVERVPPTRTPQEIRKSLLTLIDDLGGLEAFVGKGESVVVKPNVVADHGLRDGVYHGGVVTDLALVRVLIEILLTVAKEVVVAEGSSINRAETTKLFAHYGYDKLTEIAPGRVRLVDLNTDKLVRKAVPGGKRMLSREIPLTLEKADVIINLPVMKTHFAALASLSIKNLQGAIPPIEKYMSHFFGLWQNLINIHHLVKPKLHIVDGLTAQEGFGPVYGTPKTMNLLVGGTNPVAVDAVTMRIMGLEPALSSPVFLAYMQGLGPIEPDKITTVGTPVDEVRSPFEEAAIDLSHGENFKIHADNACMGCKGYLHYVLHKLRRPDPANPERLLIDRPFDKRVNVFLGPVTDAEPNPDETNLFLGICQQHHADGGKHLPGCPPHAEVIMKGLFSLYPDVKRPTYADESAEDELERMLKALLEEGRAE
jgi:uncharacterized protein (DUF362 family)